MIGWGGWLDGLFIGWVDDMSTMYSLGEVDDWMGLMILTQCM